jgi:hypothetical protein
LNELGIEKGINFSLTLTEALKEKLDVWCSGIIEQISCIIIRKHVTFLFEMGF